MRKLTINIDFGLNKLLVEF